jgi:dTDP-4-dehydrorhamnose reductase
VRLLVTGSAGQLGSHLLDAGARAGHELLGVDLSAGPGDVAEERSVDLAEPGAALASVGGFRPDVIVHTAAWTAVDDCELDPVRAQRSNVVATESVVRAAVAHDAHVVVVSTDYVFDGTKQGPYTEDDAPSPQSVYGRTKLEAERVVLAAGGTVARTSWLCSARGRNAVRTVLGAVDAGTPLRFVDDQRGQPTFAGDLADMLLLLARDRPGGVFHTTNSGPVTWFGFVREILLADGRDPGLVAPIRTAELDPPRPAPRPANSVLEARAWRRAGYPPARDFREPLAEVVATLRHR